MLMTMTKCREIDNRSHTEMLDYYTARIEVLLKRIDELEKENRELILQLAEER